MPLGLPYHIIIKGENTFQILNSSYCYATWILLSITAILNSNFIKYKKKIFSIES